MPSIIQRINLERGGFQNITEESLRQEIIEEDLNNDDAASSSSEEEVEPDRAKELSAAREEFVKDVEYAPQAQGRCKADHIPGKHINIRCLP